MYKCTNCGLYFEPQEWQTTCPKCKVRITRDFMDIFKDIFKGEHNGQR